MASRTLQSLRVLRPASSSLGRLRVLHATGAQARRHVATTRTPSTSSTKTTTTTTPVRKIPSSPSRRPAHNYPTAAPDFPDPQPATPPPATATITASPATAAAAPPLPEATAAAAGPGASDGHDWGSSFHGLSTTAFAPETARVLMRAVDAADVEIKPDGILYLPEIKYRRILNSAFGPGGWGLAPRGPLHVGDKVVSREYALIVNGRFVAQAVGECQYFSEDTITTAGEGCKSNALLRCCKDLGVASELWDPRYIRDFKKKNCHEVWVEHVVQKKKRKIWLRRDADPVYPYQLAPATAR